VWHEPAPTWIPFWYRGFSVYNRESVSRVNTATRVLAGARPKPTTGTAKEKPLATTSPSFRLGELLYSGSLE